MYSSNEGLDPANQVECSLQDTAGANHEATYILNTMDRKLVLLRLIKFFMHIFALMAIICIYSLICIVGLWHLRNQFPNLEKKSS